MSGLSSRVPAASAAYLEDDTVEDDHEVERQLDQELLALRSLRDEELSGARDADDSSASEESDGEEFQALLNYRPRCTFRPTSARGKTTLDINQQHDAPFHSSSDASVAARSSHADPVSLELDLSDFTIDGMRFDNGDAGRSARGDGTQRRNGVTGGSRPATASRSRPGTASRSKVDSEEKTRSPPSAVPPLPIFTPAEQADHDGTDAFIRAFESEFTELNHLIAQAPAPSDVQRSLLADGVDIAAWSRAQREEVTRQTEENQTKFEQEQATLLQRQQEEAARELALSGPRPDANGVLPDDTPESSQGEKSASPLPPLLTASTSPSPSPLPPLSSVTAPLPPLLPSGLPSAAKFLARSVARDAALASFAAEERAEQLRKSAALESMKRDAQKQQEQEASLRAAELAAWSQREERRLREIKAKKAQRVAELAEREQARRNTANRVREQQAMRNEDALVHHRMDRARVAADRARRDLATRHRQREQSAMHAEDERATALFRRKQAAAAEARRLRELRDAEERAERDRLDAIRVENLRRKQEEEARQAAEYARVKKEQARIQAEQEEAERARVAHAEAERKRYELEARLMKEAALRAQQEAERQEAERKRLEEEQRLAAEAEAERVRQEAIARELARRAEEEAERKAYFDRVRREKEEAARVEAERVAKEKALEEARLKQEEAERRAREKEHKRQSKAARKIQRVWRGAMVRLHDPHCAQLRAWRAARARLFYESARRIQALVRGWVLRRKLVRLRAHASSGLDIDDDFDYNGLDPEFYTIDAIPEFDMELPEEAKKMLTNAGAGGRAAVNDYHRQAAHVHPQHSSHYSPLDSPTAPPDSARDRARSAGSAAKLSSSGRGGMVSSLHAVAPPLASRVNNFMGDSSPSPSPPQDREATKFPRLPAPNSHSQPRISTAHSEPGSADRSSRPDAGPESHAHATSKSSKLAELSAAWGVSDPRTLEAMLRKKQKMAKMKKKAITTADERLEKFQRVAGHAATGHANTHGTGEQKRKKKAGVPAAWMSGMAHDANQATVDGTSSDEYSDDPRTSSAHYLGRSSASAGVVPPLHSLATNSSSSSSFAPLSPASSASLSSRSIGGPQVPGWMAASKPAVQVRKR